MRHWEGGLFLFLFAYLIKRVKLKWYIEGLLIGEVAPLDQLEDIAQNLDLTSPPPPAPSF